MTSAVYATRRAIEALLEPLDALPPWLGLALVAVVSGALMTLLYGRLTPQRWLRLARDRMAAAAHEVRLFSDSPVAIGRALGRLVAWSAASLVLMLPPLAVLGAPAGLLALHLELRHGKAPLPVGEPVVVRIDLAPGADGRLLTAHGEDGARVTAPPLVVPAEHAAYVRVEIDRPSRARLRVGLGAAAVEKELRADIGARVVSEERAQGVAALFAPGLEPPLESGPLVAIRVRHPARDATLFGLPWWVGTLVLCFAAALLVARSANITF